MGASRAWLTRSRAGRRHVASRVLSVVLGATAIASVWIPGAASAAPSTTCLPGSGLPCQQAFLQIDKTTGRVTAALALPGSSHEGADYDGVDCQTGASGHCFLAADQAGFLLMTFNSFTCDPKAAQTPIGTNASFTIDAMAYDKANGKLYAAVGSQLKVVDQTTGALTDTGAWLGNAMGASGTVELAHVTAMTFDAQTGNLFGVESMGAKPALLFRINPDTGAIVPDSFGAGMDYVSIAPDSGRNDVYGIVVSGGTMYATMSLYDADPHLATVNMATGATNDIGPEGVTPGRQRPGKPGHDPGRGATGRPVVGAPRPDTAQARRGPAPTGPAMWSARSTAGDECVSAPTDIASGPRAAMAPTLARVTPPEISRNALPLVAATAAAMASGPALSRRTCSASAASASASSSGVVTSTSTGIRGWARARRIASVIPPASRMWLVLIRMASERPARCRVPPPVTTAARWSVRRPGMVLRVQSTVTPWGAQAATNAAVVVATPDRCCRKFSATRSPARIALARPDSSATVAAGASAAPSASSQLTLRAGSTSRNTVAATAVPASTPFALARMRPREGSSARRMRLDVRSPA